MEEDWKKVEIGNMWSYKEAKIGDEIIGVYIGKKENVGDNNSNVYTLDCNGEIKDVWGSTVLDIRMQHIKIGEEVKIVYLGQLESEKRKGKSYHNFDIFHREILLEKVK